MSDFVHLHVYSHYSMNGSIAKPEDLVRRARSLGMRALALTDHARMHGVPEFYRAALSAGVKPIIGCELRFASGTRFDQEGPLLAENLVLLAKDQTGHRNLMRLVTESWATAGPAGPLADDSLLQEYADGLIVLAPGVARMNALRIERLDSTAVRGRLEHLSTIVVPGDLYVLVQDQGRVATDGTEQAALNCTNADLAAQVGLPLVATADVRMVQAADAPIQEAWRAVFAQQQASTTEGDPGEGFHLRSFEEMTTLRSDYPEAVCNTHEIAERCTVTLERRAVVVPGKSLPARVEGTPDAESGDAALAALCEERFTALFESQTPESYRKRLDTELAWIRGGGHTDYFLLLHELASWMARAGIVLGPGRGTAAGSLVLHLLGVTAFDPVEHGLLFERYTLGTDDIQNVCLDVDPGRRDDVLAHLRDVYGSDCAAAAPWFLALRACSASTEPCESLRMTTPSDGAMFNGFLSDPFADCDDLGPGDGFLVESLQAAAGMEPAATLVRRMDGVVYNVVASTMTVVLGSSPLTDSTPLMKSGDSLLPICHYEPNALAATGLLQLDVLGLRPLGVIGRVLRAIAAEGHALPDLQRVSLRDEETWDVYRSAATADVFLFESDAARGILRQVRPHCLSDLAAIVALRRPGLLDELTEFEAHKRGEVMRPRVHEAVRPMVADTYGLLIYQEQTMQVAQSLAGFSPAECDALRRASGRGDGRALQLLLVRFRDGALEHGLGAADVRRIWRQITEPTGRAVCKAHAFSYALLSYWTAYLKAYWPSQYREAFRGRRGRP